MSVVRRSWLQLYLLWSIAGFAVHLVVAAMGRQRVFLTVLLVIGIIALSSSISNAMIVGEAQQLAVSEPPTTLVAQTVAAADGVTLTPLRKPEAKQLWNSYKTQLAKHQFNQSILANLVLLASVLDLEKDVAVYQRQLNAADPLRSCLFLENEGGTLTISCPSPTQ